MLPHNTPEDGSMCEIILENIYSLCVIMITHAFVTHVYIKAEPDSEHLLQN